ncbi:STAS domain-containing protein [Amycolatopsis sp. NBC_00355]|uniref:STAS domain-containing protein n=1 Tax=Amycolatopsis sp. NBC_00355 TaxID=2975957 RepID=UPI002E25870F
MDHSEHHEFQRAATRPPLTLVGQLPATGKAPLELALARRPGVVLVIADGEIDLSTTPALSDALADVIAQHPPLLVVDLTATTFLACAGLSVLVAAHHLVGARTRLIVVAGSPATRRILHLTEVDRILTVYGRLDDALTAAAPVRRQLVLRTVVADAAILITATGGAAQGDTEAVTDELRQACELCRGVVLLDVSACTLPVADVVRSVCAVTVGEGRRRCGVRVLTTDQALIEALNTAGIAHGRSTGDR